MHEFVAWPKTTRLFRDIIVTEKLDGTNAAIHISAFDKRAQSPYPGTAYTTVVGGTRYIVSAQSRKRIITPGKTTDNFGFAAWVYENAAQLVTLLGEGLHFGEWWGQGIQRGYARDLRSFSLFNTERYAGIRETVGTATLGVVPTLYVGMFSEKAIGTALGNLAASGSVAAPHFMRPEGICVYHTASRSVSKVTLDNNDAGKWEA
ncbi:RNA ligase family protein [Streptomyces sp. SDr-06]|uniref:RNA ligase family protein n=1 Tax=Streptomyces sp. SDr-06 TaxID=2267702 RepID=UPI0016767A21|nr:RNA ligase family protein [Streptomyces sp. SDr-06]